VQGFPIVPWLALVAVYLAAGRGRGSSWSSLVVVAIGVFAAVFLEFTLAFTVGLAGLVLTVFAVAAGWTAVMVARRLRRSAGDATLLRHPGHIVGARRNVREPSQRPT
jgi:hypothetical protein